MRSLMVLSALTNIPLLVSAQCPEYVDYALEVHEPLSSGKYQLAYQRPSEECRTFKSQGLEDTITRMEGVIKDPDLYRLFQNAYPNTLDTAIAWKGYAANNTDEELTFIITGDMSQVDLPYKQRSGLSYATNILKDVEGIDIIYLKQTDVIRHPLVKRIIDAFDKEEEAEKVRKEEKK